MAERRLVLVRHAKAEPGDDDAERPLAERGRRDAAEIGRWLAAEGIEPDLVLVSPALRARQTWEAVADAVSGPRVEPDERIYANTLPDLLAVLREVPAEVGTLVVVGHAPGVQELAADLDDGSGDPDALAAIDEDYPSAGLAVFAVPGPWDAIGSGTAGLRGFAVPRG